MQKLAVVVLALWMTACAAPPLVFILAGQSNMEGAAESARLDAKADSPAPANVFIYYARFQRPDLPPQDTLLPLSRQFGFTSDHFGPELGFGLEAATLFPGRRIYLIKFAVGGTYLCDEACPSPAQCAASWFPGDSTRGPRELFPAFLKTLEGGRKAVQIRERLKGIPAIDGMVWMQGESDGIGGADRKTGKPCDGAYRDNFAGFLTALRARTGLPGFKVALGELGNIRGGSFSQAGLERVRKEQKRMHGSSLDGRVVPTRDLPMIPWSMESNSRDSVSCAQGRPCYWIHYDEAGTVELGRRFARALAGGR